MKAPILVSGVLLLGVLGAVGGYVGGAWLEPSPVDEAGAAAPLAGFPTQEPLPRKTPEPRRRRAGGRGPAPDEAGDVAGHVAPDLSRTRPGTWPGTWRPGCGACRRRRRLKGRSITEPRFLLRSEHDKAPEISPIDVN